MDLSVHRHEVARGLSALEASIARLVDALAHGVICVEIESTAGERSAIRRVCEAYSAIDYQMDDEIGNSVVCLGVVGVSPEILRRAEVVNAAKAEFKALCVRLQGIRIRIPVKGEASPTKAIPAIRVILRNIQRSDVNLLAAYRKIPLLDAPPVSVTYTRANTRSVYRKDIDEIGEILGHSQRPMVAADRARLATLERRETHLALVKQRYQNIRANVLYARLDPRGRGRVQISAELPILYARGRRAELPTVQFPPAGDAPNEPRRVRQARLEATPFLQSIPVYRYIR